MWVEGFLNALSSTNLFWLGIGTVWGLIVGILPAIGATVAVTLVLPFTFAIDPAAAIIFLVAVHASCNYGDSVSSIMINIPGSVSTVATCWDGYPLAQQGKAGSAVGMATLSSFIGGVGTWLFLAFLVRPITRIALSIGAPEYFALGVMALSLISVASKGETIKGLIMALLGLALATMGQDEATGNVYRFTFGITSLESGVPMVAFVLGTFALSQVINMLEEGGTPSKVIEVKDSILSGFSEVVKRPLTLLRAGTVGWFIGILPALGTSVAGILAYFVEKKYSKESGSFGKGAPGGLIAAEVGKGACVVGDLIPTFTLGVPGSVTGAILMAALIIHSIEPGPRFLLSGSLPYTVFAGLVLSQASFLISGIILCRFFKYIVYCPNGILAPTIAVLVFLGAYVANNSVFDIFVALALGGGCYALGKLKYSTVCMVLGLILGRLLETNFHRSLGASFGSYSIFIERPIAVIILAITLLFLVGPYLWYFMRTKLRQVPQPGVVEGADSGVQSVSIGEPMLLAGIAVVFATFLVIALEYPAAVGLFPRLICTTGLAFIVWRFLVIVRHISFDHMEWISRRTLFSGKLGWHWSVITMVGYGLCIGLFGFVVSSAIYVSLVILLIGSWKWRVAVSTGSLVAVSMYVLAKITQLALPLGLLEFLR